MNNNQIDIKEEQKYLKKEEKKRRTNSKNSKYNILELDFLRSLLYLDLFIDIEEVFILFIIIYI